MPFVSKYPYTDLNNLNLDWLLERVKSLVAEMHDWQSANQLHYEGTWDITKQYQAWSIVVNNSEGYVSLKPVPEGIALDNTEYWELIADYTAIVADLGDRVTLLESDVNTIEDKITNLNWLSGKKIVWFGDSWGTITNNVVAQFTTLYGNKCTVDNRCIGGTTLTRVHEEDFPGFGSNSGYQRIRAANLTDFDYIFIMYGVNDWQCSVPLLPYGSDQDEFVYTNALAGILDYIATNYPTCQPVVIFPTYVHRNSIGFDLNHHGATIHSYINHGIDVCNNRGVKYINQATLLGVNKDNYTEFMINDGNVWLHPNANTAKALAENIYQGAFNNGKCYSGNWSKNIIGSMIPINRQNTDYDDRIVGVPYLINRIAKVGASYQSYIINGAKANKTVIRLSGYADLGGHVGGIYCTIADSDLNNSESLAFNNITYDGYFEAYLEIDGHPDIIAPYITSDGTIPIYGYQIEVLEGDSTAYGMTLQASSGMTLVNGDTYVDIIDGIAYFKGAMYTADQAYTPLTNIINIQAYTSAPHYIHAYNLTKDESLILYTDGSYLKTSFNIASGDNIIIPCFSIPIN